MVFKKQKNHYKGAAHIEVTFSKDGQFVDGGKYTVNSPEIVDTANKPVFSAMQRYWLKPGKYQMNLKITDVNRPGSEGIDASQEIEITQPQDAQVSFSDVELLESFTKTEVPNDLSKSGYDLSPYVMRYYPESFNKLIFYTEAYNALQKLGAEGRFLFSYYVEGASHDHLNGLQAHSKQKAAEVNPLLGQFDISGLSTGDYTLVIEARNTANELIAEKKLPFTRFANIKIDLQALNAVDTAGTFVSQVHNLDTLKDYIACLWPISSTTERDWQYNQVRNADVKIMQQYLYAFWVNRDNKNPEAAWKRYRAEAVKVKKEFACGKIPGYMTDRGRVYLQYGAPSAAQQSPAEPDSYPYEIWQYYRLKDPTTGQFQTNKKFVFYNRELDGKCFELLHSDARGELRNDRWQLVLKQRSNQIMNLDVNAPQQKTYGSSADDLFQNPR
jgi:GWxTD domain-containing protein